jgi:hypothetical protein
VALCLWVGANPHAPAPNPSIGIEDPETEEGEEATSAGHLEILKKLEPDPTRDDFGHLYQFAKSESVIVYLATIEPPKDLTSALSWHIRWMVDPLPWSIRFGSSGTVAKLLTCGGRWGESDRRRSMVAREGPRV